MFVTSTVKCFFVVVVTSYLQPKKSHFNSSMESKSP